MDIKKDFLGRELNIGDEVVYTISSNTYFEKGTIYKVTNVLVHIRHISGYYTAQRLPEKVIKII